MPNISVVRWHLPLILLLIMTAVSLAPASIKQPVVADIRIEIGAGAGDRKELEQIARRLIYLREGAPFSESAFSGSVAALKRSGLFKSIDIPDPDWSADRIELVFRLKPFARVKKIRVQGGFPLLEKEILGAMTMAVGDACDEEKIPLQEERVKDLFLKQGYLRPEVSVRRQVDPADGHCLLEVDIDKGPYYRVESARLLGNERFSDFRLKLRLSVWFSSLLPGGASRLVTSRVKEDSRALRQFYREKGYPEAEVEAEVEKYPEAATARVIFTISEGPRCRVTFEGNREFWDYTLKKELALFEDSGSFDLRLRKSVRNLEKRYRAAGYPEVEIRTEESWAGQAGRSPRNLVFVIREGRRYLVESVKLSGLDALDEKTVRDEMLTARPGLFHPGSYVPEDLDGDIRAIKALYEEAGYRQVSLEKTVETRPASDRDDLVEVSVRLDIEEGPRTMVEDVSVRGELPIPADLAGRITAMSAGTPFRQDLVRDDRDALAAAVSEQGYPYVTVEPEVVFSQDGTGADITYLVDPGPAVRMGEVFFTGDFRTRRRILEREVQPSPGEPFSLSKILESQRNIRSIAAIDTAGFKIFGLERQADRVDMLAEIQEGKPYFVEMAAGYDTRRLFYLNAAAGDRNLLGLNKQLRADLELSQIGHRASLDLNEPRFFGSRVSSGTTLYAEETEGLNQDFGIRSYGVSQRFARPLTRRLSGSLNFRFESRDQYRTDNQPIPEEEVEEYDRRAVLTASPGLSYNSTDSYLMPSRGIRVLVTMDASRGIDNSLDDFFKYRLKTQYYYSPWDRLTLAFHGRFGYIDPYGSNERVAEDQLFFLGGTADVRGFPENKLRVDENRDPVGGRTVILGSAEARFDLGLNFEAAVFYDTGAVRDTFTESGSDDFRKTAGLALRYKTPIGPMGGMYGWKLDRRSGESAGAFHFSIGYTF
ncbi:MAG: outer membrane protein assembly factor BamA [Desulfosudaceae bacterium]